ncbi:MAG: cytosine permease [Woeseiaceae bacterium]|nr:cytosine permease [Woeseiaceae bacterium]
MSVREERAFGRTPLLPEEREYDTRGAHTTNFAYAIATWCFLIGGYIAQLVGAVQGLVCLVAGTMIGAFLTTMPLGLGCHRYGLEQMDCCTPSFGTRGIKILLVFYLINMLGWSGLILVMFGNGIQNIIEAIGFQTGDWIVGAGVALGFWLSYLMVTRGVHLLNIATSIITPGLALLIAYMFYVLFRDYGWERIAAAPPLDPGPDSLKNYLICIELGIANGISWFGGIGFLARNTRRRRNAIYPELVQLGFMTGVVSSIGLFSALVIQSDDPTEWMIPLGGVYLGILALIFVALANITSTAVSLFASGLAIRHVHIFRDRKWRQLIVILIMPCVPFVFWPHQLADAGDAFLAFNGTMYGPVSGILFADFIFLRRQKYNLWSIFEDHPNGSYHYAWGFNWIAIGSLLLGQALYIWLYNPGTGETHPLFFYINPSIAACVVPAVTYAIGMKLLGWHEKSIRVSEDQLRRNKLPPGQRLIDPNI